jgi:transcriptional regulator with XRE-family HTH domain
MSSVFSGVQLRAKIKSSGARVEDIAVLTGLSFTHLTRLMRGEVRPSTRTVEALAEVLGCDVGEFFADDGTSRALPPPGGTEPPPPLAPATRAKLRALLDLREGGAA